VPTQMPAADIGAAGAGGGGGGGGGATAPPPPPPPQPARSPKKVSEINTEKIRVFMLFPLGWIH